MHQSPTPASTSQIVDEDTDQPLDRTSGGSPLPLFLSVSCLPPITPLVFVDSVIPANPGSGSGAGAGIYRNSGSTLHITRHSSPFFDFGR